MSKSKSQTVLRPAITFVASFIGETNFIEGRIGALSNGTAEIETAVGILRTTTIYHDFENGERVIYSIRPESIHIGDEIPAGASNPMNAKVLQTTYLGSIEEYQLAIAEKLKAKASLYHPRGKGKTVGETVNCCIHPEDVIPLPMDKPSNDT